ncbi:MAG: Mu transposase C-terminal domain-containing protein [Candidatus Cloacimonetes bacterium]|nr:Mu transposase C-terminal domain-containing protein [Candidatus Cloacimonadota bacterium]
MNEFQGLENAELSDRMNEVGMADMSACNLNVSADTMQDPSQTAWEVARQEDRVRAWAKFEIVKTFISYRMEYSAKGFKYSESGESFVRKLHNGEICIEAYNQLKVSKLALPTIITWERMLRVGGDLDSPYSLLESYRHCGRKSRIDASLRSWIMELAIDQRDLDPNWIYLFLVDQYEMMDKQLPISPRTLQLLVRDFRKNVFTKSLGKGSKEIKNKVKLHNVRINDLMPGELYESDGHHANFFVKSPFYCHRSYGKRYLVRPVIIFWIDVATGTIVGYRACLTENKGAVKNSLMDAISRFGTPQKIRVDNGGAYKNVDYAPWVFYSEAIGKRRLTTDEKIAKRMLESGDKGLYMNLGIECHFTIPGNPESKSIEPFWKYGISAFEKSFLSWCGNNPESRPEMYKNMDSKTLVRKFGEKFPTWDEFTEKLDRYVEYWNNKPRASLVTIEGEQLSPLQAYTQVEHVIPHKTELLGKMLYPYIEMRTVQRSMIEKNGVLYWHPSFASMIGQKVGIYYDEKNLNEITICNEKGQIHPERAIAIDPGLQSGDDLTALIENNRRAKIGKLYYLALSDVAGAMKTEKMLKLLSKELLPLSNTKEAEDIKYLSFEEALDAIGGEYEEIDEISDGILAIEKDMPNKDKTEINQELIDDLKDEIAGLFGE